MPAIRVAVFTGKRQHDPTLWINTFDLLAEQTMVPDLDAPGLVIAPDTATYDASRLAFALANT